MTDITPNKAGVPSKRRRNPNGWPYVKFSISGVWVHFYIDPEILLQLDRWRADRGIPSRVEAVRKIMEYAIHQPRPDGTFTPVNKKAPLLRQFDEYCNERLIFRRAAGINSVIAFVVSQPWPVGSAMPVQGTAVAASEPEPETATTTSEPVKWWESPEPVRRGMRRPK